ncbi:Hypothetical predicted protein, partial [Paramuricea clavata]
ISLVHKSTYLFPGDATKRNYLQLNGEFKPIRKIARTVLYIKTSPLGARNMAINEFYNSSYNIVFAFIACWRFK